MITITTATHCFSLAQQKRLGKQFRKKVRSPNHELMTLAKMAVAEVEEVQDPEGHEEEVKVEAHRRIHHFRKAGVLRNHRTWRVPEELVEVKEEGDLITDPEGLEEEGQLTAEQTMDTS